MALDQDCSGFLGYEHYFPIHFYLYVVFVKAFSGFPQKFHVVATNNETPCTQMTVTPLTKRYVNNNLESYFRLFFEHSPYYVNVYNAGHKRIYIYIKEIFGFHFFLLYNLNVNFTEQTLVWE